MKAQEAGFLLLTSPLGNPERKVLTTAQLRNLGKRIQNAEKPDVDRGVDVTDLLHLGYAPEMAQHIWLLMQEEELLQYYLQKAKGAGCLPLTRVSADYPAAISQKLGLEGPGSLWYKGDISMLKGKLLALVGSRELDAENQRFAAELGYRAACQGYTLVSGNARGADQTAQNACLEAGGKVICVVADSLGDKRQRENVLYLSEDGFDLPFTALRALSRNRIIHALGEAVFVAQCGYQTGGTWSGTVKNLRFGWSPVYCYRDESPAQQLLADMGAGSVELDDLKDLAALTQLPKSLFD